jgi:hypothetical protein
MAPWVCPAPLRGVAGVLHGRMVDARGRLAALGANRWSDTLKAKNKANPRAMLEVKLGSAATPAFKPDAQSLKRQVLECSALAWRLPKVDAGLQSLFPFTSLAKDSDIAHLVQTLQKAAASHPKTTGHELAVVLPDPVGYAAELNAMRLIAHKRGLRLKAEDEHKLQSHFVLRGLVDNVADLRALNNVAPVLSRASFEALQKTSPQRMQGATWEALTENERPSLQQVGRMWSPQARQGLAQQAPQFKALAKKEIEAGYDPAASQAWVQALADKTAQALAPFEQQWLTGRDHPAVGEYFALHFDENERNRVGTVQDHSPGATYSREVAHIDGPPPTTSVALLDAYMAAYLKLPEDPYAFAVRALVANQKELIKDLSTQLAGDPNVDVTQGGGMRDKTVDFIKGLLDVKGEVFRVKYGWLTNAAMGFAVGPAHNLAAAVGAYATLQGADGLAKRPKVAKLALNTAAWVGGMDTALKTAMTQQVVRPVLVQVWVDRGLVNHAIRGPGGNIEGWRGAHDGGRQRVTLLTDTERLKKGSVDVQALLGGADGTEVARGTKAGEALAAKATGAIVLNAATGLSAQQGAALFAAQVEEARKLGATIRAAIPTGAKAIGLSIDGRLALASVVVQTMGLLNGIKAVDKAEAELAAATEVDRAEKEKALRDAKFGYLDSLGGLTAGCLETLRVGAEAMNVQRGAAAGAVALGSIHALKFGAQVAGVFGGFLNGYVSYQKAGEAYEMQLSSVVYLQISASVSFGITGLAAGAPIASSGLSYMAARHIGGKAVQGAAMRLAAGVAAGGWIPVAGWVMLGVGIVASVGAALLEPTKIEAWARQTPFGKGPADKKFPTLDAQNEDFNKAMGLAAEPGPKRLAEQPA